MPKILLTSGELRSIKSELLNCAAQSRRPKKKKEKKETSGTQGIRLHAYSGKLPYDLIAHFDNIFLRKAVNKL